MREDGISERVASTVHNCAQTSVLALNKGNVEEHFTRPRSEALLLVRESEETQGNLLRSTLNKLVM